MTATFRDDISRHLPHLRALGRMLSRDRTLADDLVQETVLRALNHEDQYTPGTNLKAWLSTILRNTYFNELRRRARLTHYGNTVPRESARDGEQEGRLQMRDFERAFRALSPVQREALTLVAASGFSYEEASLIAGCAVGTMKSRVSRARLELHQLLEGAIAA